MSAAIRRDIRHFGGATVLADGLQLANYRIDVFILAIFVPVPEIGVYSVAVMLAEVLWQVPNAMARVLLARMSAGGVSRGHVLSIGLRLGGVITGLGVFGLAASALLIPVVLGETYSDVLRLLAILLPGVIVLGAAKPLAAWTLSQGHAGRNLRASALGFGTAIAADVALIPWLGVTGAAVASTLSYLVTAAAVVRLLPGRGVGHDPGPTEVSPAAFPASS